MSEQILTNTTGQGSGLVKKAFSKVGGFGGLIDVGLGLYFGIGEFEEERRKGSSFIWATTKAVGDYFLGEVAGPYMLAYSLGKAAIVGGYTAFDVYRRTLPHVTTPFSNQYNDSQAAYTMRQRAVQAIQNSKLNARSALGNEAQYLHR